MSGIAKHRRVQHLVNSQWGLGEIVGLYPTGICSFFEWVGERFNLQPQELRILADVEAPSNILDTLRIHGNSQANHSVYAIQLHNSVWSYPAFRQQNPTYNHKRLCLYVGSTGLDPQTRFANHKRGHKSNWFAQQFGQRLIHEIVSDLNPRRYEVALATEFEFARKLRNEGYAVFQN